MRIIILDDDPLMATVLAASLRSRNFAALSFTEASAALAALEPDDILVTDFVLPGRDGLDVARQAYREGWRGPLFVMSGRVDSVTAPAEGPRLVSFIRKPFPVETLLQVLAPPPVE
jgi:DNA-binding response OmpR family regulator